MIDRNREIDREIEDIRKIGEIREYQNTGSMKAERFAEEEEVVHEEGLWYN